MVVTANVVDQQAQRPAVIPHDHVNVAVVIDVSESRTAPHLRQLEYSARSFADILEQPVAGIPEQLLSLIIGEWAVRAPFQRDPSIDRQEIEETIVIEIEPRGSKTSIGKGGGPKPGSGAHILKGCRTVVDQQVGALASQIREKEILVAVVVEIAGIDAHACLGFAKFVHRDAGAKTGLLERAVALVDPQE